MQETKSNWAIVADLMKSEPPVHLGSQTSDCFHHNPRHLLHSQTYYKFAAKMIGKSKRVIDVGCSEGLGTYVLGKECGYAKGIDSDAMAIRSAKSNFSSDSIQFEERKLPSGAETYDAAISFSKDSLFLLKPLTDCIAAEGLVIVGTQSSAPDSLEEQMRKYFQFVFIFAANGEIVRTGCLSLANYLIAIGSKKKL